jgi:RHS repeat-associated protein
LGAVIQKRAYGTYGGEADQGEVRGTSTPPNDPDQMTLQPNATTIHPFGYTGRRWDADLGLYYYRARWYDPTLGTFLETDPIGALDYINLYSYVGLEPGNGVDPTGMVCVSCIKAAGRLVGGRLVAAGIASQVDSPIPGPGDVVGAGIAVFSVGAVVYDVGKALVSDEPSSVTQGPTRYDARSRDSGPLKEAGGRPHSRPRQDGEGNMTPERGYTEYGPNDAVTGEPESSREYKGPNSRPHFGSSGPRVVDRPAGERAPDGGRRPNDQRPRPARPDEIPKPRT